MLHSVLANFNLVGIVWLLKSCVKISVIFLVNIYQLVYHYASAISWIVL